MKKGMTSVTFRKFSVEQNIAIARENRLDGIEWGGDIHVPPENAENAISVFRKTADAGLSVLAYGSYYRLGLNENPEKYFSPVLETAVLLNTTVIRVWAGDKGSAQYSDIEFEKAVSDAKIICGLAAKHNITVALEYHRNTITDNSKSALMILKAVDTGNFKTYWQPNPELSFSENLNELNDILPYLSNIHVFHWSADNKRLPLSEGKSDWLQYLKAASGEHSAILEFVKNENVDQFGKDSQILTEILENCQKSS